MHRIFVLLIGLVGIADSSYAQLAIPGAGDDKFGLLLGGKSITVSTGEAKLGFNWTNDPHLTADDDCKQFMRGTPEYTACILASVDKSQNFVDINIGITGEKGKRSLFSGGHITPGMEFGITATRRFEKKSSNHGGFTDLYGGFVASTKPLTVATIGPDQSSSMDDGVEKVLGGNAGVNFFMRENFGVGFGASVKRGFSTPGVQKAASVCEVKASGINENGHPIQITDCNDGYVGPLPDQWVESFRIDVMRIFTRVKTDPATKKNSAVVTVGLIGSFNVSHRSDTPAIYNIAFGPTLHPKGVPHKVLLATVFGFSDITDAQDKGKTLRDKFGVKVYFGVPLTGF
jgi:hypothetical protein